MVNNYTASVIGARGYVGLETAQLLLSHPHVELTHCYATSGFKLSNHLPLEKTKTLFCGDMQTIDSDKTDFYFLATPAEASMELAPKLLAKGSKVIDLSGAFRLKTSSYKTWYGFEHKQSALLQSAHFGLMPWFKPTAETTFIANPGCYSSATLMALLPLLKQDLINIDTLVIDAKSGTTGAGKKVSENILFSEVADDCLPYKIARHQHFPEIQEIIKRLTGLEINPHFSTHLLPTRRGITVGLYAQLKKSVDQQTVQMAFADAYAQSPLIEWGAIDDNSSLLSLRKVVGTARTHIAYQIDGNKLYVFSAIDNLLKGAASQAIENMNAMIGIPHHTGLNNLRNML